MNYYIKHLLVDAEGNFAKATEWLTDNNDPKIVCHPVIALMTDLMWTRVGVRSFLLGKAWFMITLSLFLCSQSILNRLGAGAAEPPSASSSSSTSGVRLAGAWQVANRAGRYAPV